MTNTSESESAVKTEKTAAEAAAKSGAKASGDSNAVLRAAGATGAAVFISRILGLVREQVFAILFGAGNAMDAFLIAFRIPNLLRDLFAEGAMSAALVPTFLKVRKEEGDRRAWQVAGQVFRILFVVVSILSVLGIWLAPQMVALYAGDFREVPGKFDLAVLMTRVMFPYFPLVAVAAAFMGVLNACGKFFLPAFSSSMFNLVSILAGIALTWLAPRYGYEPIVGMAAGVVLGGLAQALLQVPQLYRVGYRWPKRESTDPSMWRDPALRRMLMLMVPGLMGLAATQVNILVNSFLAASQGPGAVSWLGYAFRLMQFPIGIFGVSLAVATLPMVSAGWVDRDYARVSQGLTRSLRNVMAVNLPAAAGLAFLGVPVIQLIFEYGRFTPADTRATAMALAGYSVGLAAYSMVKVLVPACYGMGNTRIPVISSALSVAANLALNLLFIGPLGYWGLALGTSLAAMFNAAFLLVAVRRMMGKVGGAFPLGPIAGGFAVNTLIALAMGGLCWVSYDALNRWLPEQWVVEQIGGWLGTAGLVFVRAVKVLAIVGEGVIAVIALAWMLRVPETIHVVKSILRRLRLLPKSPTSAMVGKE